MPFTRRYFEIPEDNLTGERDDYAWGFSLGMQYVEQFDIKIKPPIAHVPSRLCIHSAFKSVEKEPFSARQIAFMADFAEESKLKICGPAFGNLACSVVEDGRLTGYFEVWLPVEEEA